VNVVPRPFNVLSLCSGAGGLDLGVKLAVPDSRVVCYVEREAYLCEVLVRRMEEGCLDEAPVWTNVRTFAGSPWRGHVDLVIGGYPCQPFSSAGKRLGEADPRHLWPLVLEVVRALRPRRVLLENVPGHRSKGFGRVLGDLAESGYNTKWACIPASNIGAAHKRERLFAIATNLKSI
jgi:DNA (cytosine-5)-methyltransferase 1